jgi:hydroxymethylpyrimidine pyrophosphatase-like HAD family hydrolase
MEKIKLIATDLDGTFLRDDKSIPQENIDSLELLEKNKVVRVAATGRNLKKVREVIPPGVPSDFVVFSSGAGIYDWQEGELIYRQDLSAETSQQLALFLQNRGIGFFVFRAVPENHFLWFSKGADGCEEFRRYLSYHNSLASELPHDCIFGGPLSQFLVILPNKPRLFEALKNEVFVLFDEVGVIRTTSPFGTNFIWMELFHKSVSKGNALDFLCKKQGIPVELTAGLGNDFNDLEMLNFTRHSFLVANSHEELKPGFLPAPTNNDGAFAYVANMFYG